MAFLFDVGIDGKTKNIKIVDSSPPGIFDALAMKAVETYRYKPMVKDGAVIEAKNVRIIVSFEMAK